MIWTLIEQTANVAEAVILVYFLQDFLEINPKYKTWVINTSGFFLMLFVVNIMNYLYVFEGIGIFIYIGIFVIFAEIFYTRNKWIKALAPVLFFQSIVIINIVSAITVSKIINVPIYSLMAEQTFYRLFMLVLTKALIFGLVRLLIHTKRRDYLKTREWIGLMSALVLLIFILNMVFEMIMMGKVSPDSHQSIYILIAAFIAITGSLYYLVLRISEAREENMKYRLLKIDHDTRERHLGELQSMYRRVMTIKHDMKHIIFPLRAELPDSYLKKVGTYLDHIEQLLEEIAPAIPLEDQLLGQFLSGKKSYCNELGIDLFLSVTPDVRMSNNLDLMILLGNLTDNAIEACRKSVKKKMNIHMQMHRKYLIIEVINTCDPEELRNNQDFKTSKANKDEHGFGMISIAEIIGKYDGIITSKKDSNAGKVHFTVTLPEKAVNYEYTDL